MDIIRDTKPQKKRRRLLWSLGGIALLGLTIFVPRLLPTAVPTVDGNTVWRDTVQFGTLVRQVRGPGTLVPEQRRFITAVTAGRIEQILALPGARVEAGDTLLVVESMKMEIPVTAPAAGTVRSVAVAPADVVEEGDVLAVIDADG